MALTSVLLSEETQRRLGEEGLDELTACLWAVDCQTCGALLGDEPPALCVDDSIVMATASLHHEGCRPPEWNDSAVIVRAAGDYVSYVTPMMLIPVAVGRREPEPWPLMVVNPGLEYVSLVRGGRWRVGHGAGFAGAGLVRPGRELRAGVPVGGAVARVMESSVAVSFQVPPVHGVRVAGRGGDHRVRPRARRGADRRDSCAASGSSGGGGSVRGDVGRADAGRVGRRARR